MSMSFVGKLKLELGLVACAEMGVKVGIFITTC